MNRRNILRGGRATLTNRPSPQIPTHPTSSPSTPLRRQLYHIQEVAGPSQRAPATAPVLNHPPQPHDPPTNLRLPYSPRGQTFLPPAPNIIANPPKIDSFPNPCHRNFDTFLIRSNSRKIFTIEKRDHYRRHLRNPLASAQGLTTQEHARDGNCRTHALRSFTLEQEEVFLRASQFGNTYF
jgi:hypothetical protein